MNKKILVKVMAIVPCIRHALLGISSPVSSTWFLTAGWSAFSLGDNLRPAASRKKNSLRNNTDRPHFFSPTSYRLKCVSSCRHDNHFPISTSSSTTNFSQRGCDCNMNPCIYTGHYRLIQSRPQMRDGGADGGRDTARSQLPVISFHLLFNKLLIDP